MNFKIIATSGNKLRTYDFNMNIFRNGYLIDHINEKYFNNAKNKKLIADYIYEQDPFKNENILREKNEFDSHYLLNPPSYGLRNKYEEETKKVFYNIYYNTLVEEFNSSGLNLFMAVEILPNLDGYGVYYIRNDNLEWFNNVMKKLNNSKLFSPYSRFSDENGSLQFCRDYEAGLIAGDVIVMHGDYFFDEEIETEYMYDSGVDLLLSKEFTDYLKENKGEMEDWCYTDIVEHYLENKKENMEVDPTLEHYIKFIHTKKSKDNTFELIPNDVENLTFIYKSINEIIKDS